MQIVIESRQRPAAAVMAPGAIVAERLAVRIIVCVAGSAVGGRIVETVAHMAFAASDGGVQARERETREIVIEASDG